MLYKLDIKPLSVNRCWRGRRFKTKDYEQYEIELMNELPDTILLPESGIPLQMYIQWGFSSAASDWDNPIKPFQDILQNKYGFNDRNVHLGLVCKHKVKKGEDYIHFRIGKLNDLKNIITITEELFNYD